VTAALALASITLAACNPSSARFVELDQLNPEERACFEKVTTFPKNVKRLTEKQAFDLIVQLKRSELEKNGCGQTVIAKWDAYATAAREANVK
jgi:hypothetical protein